MAKKKKEKVTYAKVQSPLGGFIAWPRLLEPEGFNGGKEKYSVDVYVPFDIWKKSPQAKAMRAEVLRCAKDYYEDDDLTLEDFKGPFELGDDLELDYAEGHIRIRFKSDYPPTIVDRNKEPLSEKEIKKIKSGDFAIVVGSPYGWDFGKKDGISMNFDVLQFVKPGEPLSGGRSAALKAIEAIEIDEDELGSEDEEEEKPKRGRGRPKGSTKKKLDEDEEEEKPKSKKRPAPDDDDDEEDEKPKRKHRQLEEDDEDEEEEKPKKKRRVVEDDDEDEEEEKPRKKRSGRLDV